VVGSGSKEGVGFVVELESWGEGLGYFWVETGSGTRSGEGAELGFAEGLSPPG